MKAYLLSLGAGLLVGVVYATLKVKSPAPPVIALVGLLGILIGEHLVSFTRQRLGHSAPPAASHAMDARRPASDRAPEAKR